MSAMTSPETHSDSVTPPHVFNIVCYRVSSRYENHSHRLNAHWRTQTILDQSPDQRRNRSALLPETQCVVCVSPYTCIAENTPKRKKKNIFFACARLCACAVRFALHLYSRKHAKTKKRHKKNTPIFFGVFRGCATSYLRTALRRLTFVRLLCATSSPYCAFKIWRAVLRTFSHLRIVLAFVLYPILRCMVSVV